MKCSAFASGVFMIAATASVAQTSDLECYDLKVRAKPVAQIPTVLSQDDDPDMIIMSWPWFLDLKVTRTIDGDLPSSLVTVLAVMHTSFKKKTMTWLLRRNTVGTYNLIRSSDPDEVPRCTAGTPLAVPYLRPGPDETYADYRREGEKMYSTEDGFE